MPLAGGAGLTPEVRRPTRGTCGSRLRGVGSLGARGCSEPGEQARTRVGGLGCWPWRQREAALPLWERKALVRL